MLREADSDDLICLSFRGAPYPGTTEVNITEVIMLPQAKINTSIILKNYVILKVLFSNVA